MILEIACSAPLAITSQKERLMTLITAANY